VTKKSEKAARVAAAKRAAYFKKTSTLLGHVYRLRELNDEIDAAYAAEIPAETIAATIASREPVGRAVHPLKAASVAAAEKWAIAYAAKVKVELEAVGFDVDGFAPYPDRASGLQYGTISYNLAKDKYAKYHRFVRDLKGARRMGEKGEYAWEPTLVARFVQHAKEDAAINYDLFILKLVAKIGACDAAELDGDHVWSHSILTVRKGAAVERWKTKQIENVSVLGKYFPQWPTRLLKDGAK